MSSSEDEDSFSSPSPSPSQQKENKKKAANTKTIEQRYQKKSQLEHILLRPDTYIGSTEVHTQQLWVMEDAEGSEQSPSMTFKTINYVPGLYKIVDEILVNAADVKAREGEEKKDKPIKPGARRMSAIKIDINSQTGRISIWNDGEGIPVAIHQVHKVYVPEMIFGQLLTSDNYDDSECRVTGGRNGYGAKLTNIFSQEFTVECADGERKKKFRMTWTGNMGKKTEPEISNYPGTDFVKISFIPDFAKFGMTGWEPDILSLLRKRAYDLAGTSGVRVYLNGSRIEVNSFSQYVDLYLGGSSDKKRKNKKGTAGGGKKKRGGGEGGEEDAGEDEEDDPSSEEGEDEDDADDDDVWEEAGSARKKKNKNTKSKGKKGRKKKRGGTREEGDAEEEENVDEDGDGPDGEGEIKKVIKIHEKQWRWEVVISSTDGGQFQQVSFVNSICTTKGGSHVTHVIEPLLSAIVKKANAKNRGGMEIKPAHVKQHLWVFVSCLIVNPAFDSQTKETLTTKPAKFGSKCLLSDKTINAVVRSPIVENVVLWAQTKQQVELRKQMKVGKTKGRERLSGIPKLEDANDAGGRHSQECTLILTEGDSAKTSCLAGLSVVGRDRFGVFPLRGKLLNVRDASFKQLTENKEIQSILKIVGLQVNDKTEDSRGLRYGSLMIMTDQDHDGSHIKGLLINMLHHYWPQLLKCRGFLKEFVTPIVKVSKNNVEKAFYTIPEYEQWKRSVVTTGWKIKYYKGLGTSTDREFKEYFSDLGKHKIDFVWSGEHDGELIDMAFNKRRSEDRKRWLQSYQEGTFVDHSASSSLSYADFVNKELILFSRYDTERSIPQLVDGWKPGQRKVLFACIKKNMKQEIKVAQLAGYVSEVSAYHHGEASLQQTIVSMAQRFVGSNNLNFLEPVGQFGSRKEGGKDASAARYIFTRLSFFTRLIFHEADDPLLEYEYEEGQRIEPKMYVPVIPTVLVNGSEGIGTGWSSFVPNYNPRDIIRNLKRYIDGEEMIRMTPWYRGFKGKIEANSTGTGFETSGLIHKCEGEENTYLITELPIKRWTQDYKEWLEEQLPTPEKRDTLIADYRDCSSHEEIHFTVKVGEERLERPEREGLEKYFKLKTSLSTTNLTLFDPNGRVQKYANELEIIKEFAPIRLDFYHRRKGYCLAMLEKSRRIMSNRLRFILAVINGEIVISNKRKKLLIEELFSKGYDPMKEIEQAAEEQIRNSLKRDVAPDDETLAQGGDDENEDELIAGCTAKDYDYLLGMPMWSLTLEKVDELRGEMREKEIELEDLKRTSVQTLWKRDLDALLEALDKLDAHDEMLLQEGRRFQRKAQGGGGGLLRGKAKSSSSSKAVALGGGGGKKAKKPPMEKTNKKKKKAYDDTSEETISSSSSTEISSSSEDFEADLADSDDGEAATPSKKKTKRDLKRSYQEDGRNRNLSSHLSEKKDTQKKIPSSTYQSGGYLHGSEENESDQGRRSEGDGGGTSSSCVNTPVSSSTSSKKKLSHTSSFSLGGLGAGLKKTTTAGTGRGGEEIGKTTAGKSKEEKTAEDLPSSSSSTKTTDSSSSFSSSSPPPSIVVKPLSLLERLKLSAAASSQSRGSSSSGRGSGLLSLSSSGEGAKKQLTLEEIFATRISSTSIRPSSGEGTSHTDSHPLKSSDNSGRDRSASASSIGGVSSGSSLLLAQRKEDEKEGEEKESSEKMKEKMCETAEDQKEKEKRHVEEEKKKSQASHLLSTKASSSLLASEKSSSSSFSSGTSSASSSLSFSFSKTTVASSSSLFLSDNEEDTSGEKKERRKDSHENDLPRPPGKEAKAGKRGGASVATASEKRKKNEEEGANNKTRDKKNTNTTKRRKTFILSSDDEEGDTSDSQDDKDDKDSEESEEEEEEFSPKKKKRKTASPVAKRTSSDKKNTVAKTTTTSTATSSSRSFTPLSKKSTQQRKTSAASSSPRKKKKKSDEDDEDEEEDNSEAGDDEVFSVASSPISSNRPRRQAASAPKKYKIEDDSSDELTSQEEDDESDASVVVGGSDSDDE